MKTKIYFVCAALMIFLSSSIIVCPPESTGVTYFPDPEDCASFYECYDGILTHYTCPSGLVFNPDINKCDAGYTDCGDRPDKNYWREKEKQTCQCMDITADNGIRYNLVGTACVPSGTGSRCTNTGLCTVPGYANCYRQ